MLSRVKVKLQISFFLIILCGFFSVAECISFASACYTDATAPQTVPPSSAVVFDACELAGQVIEFDGVSTFTFTVPDYYEITYGVYSGLVAGINQALQLKLSGSGPIDGSALVLFTPHTMYIANVVIFALAGQQLQLFNDNPMFGVTFGNPQSPFTTDSVQAFITIKQIN